MDVTHISFSADGYYLASTSCDKTVNKYNKALPYYFLEHEFCRLEYMMSKLEDAKKS